jgi:hypothetical protein
MNLFERALLLSAILLTGCGTTRNVAVTSYHVTRGAAVGSYKVARAVAVGSYRVASAPVRLATRNRGEPKMVGTPEATESDVTEPGQPVPPPEVEASPRRQPEIETETSQSPRRTAPRTARETTQSKPQQLPPPQVPSTEAEFPTAKAVPGKPGYVFSPFDDSERYVDVSGYAPGTKVKDPWTNKIFLVP